MTKELRVCVPLRLSSFEEVINAASKAKERGADLVEIWLDALPFSLEDATKDKNLLNELCDLIDLPILCVCKAKEEKGSFEGTEMQRVSLLQKAALSGVDYIDIGIHTDPDLIENLKNTIEEAGGLTQLIISYHNFKETPDQKTLKDIATKAKTLGADIIKIATQANKEEDNDTVLKAVENEKAVALCMGPLGARSRTENPNSLWTYRALNKRSRTAPGQLTL